jgi:anti-sigma B factor antagonist
MPMVNIDTRRVHGVLLVDISGRLNSSTADDAEDRIANIAQGEDKLILLNLEKLEYVTSAGLRVILRGARLLQENRGELKICNARGAVKDALEMFGFPSLLKVYDSEKEALSAFLA